MDIKKMIEDHGDIIRYAGPLGAPPPAQRVDVFHHIVPASQEQVPAAQPPTVQSPPDDTAPTSQEQLPSAVLGRRKRRMSVHFHRGYLLFGLVLAAITVVSSLIVYPEWMQSNKTVFALLVLVMLSVPTFIANFRKAYE